MSWSCPALEGIWGGLEIRGWAGAGGGSCSSSEVLRVPLPRVRGACGSRWWREPRDCTRWARSLELGGHLSALRSSWC